MEEYLAVGKVINTHGVRGELKVLPLTSDVSRFNYLKLVWVERNGNLLRFDVEKTRYHKQYVLIKLYGVDTMDKAREFKDCYLKVDRENARPLDEDEYFIADLIDCEVYENDTLLGTVTDVLQAGGNDCYVVKGKLYGEILIPAVQSVVHKVDIGNRKISVSLPEGLVNKK
ncbi:MAG: 16S rRNA processing protein RimM [Clostridiaceae bacterium]|nr:16S rRNA processing protein RimM [Clostridiaceae bacterium]